MSKKQNTGPWIKYQNKVQIRTLEGLPVQLRIAPESGAETWTGSIYMNGRIVATTKPQPSADGAKVAVERGVTEMAAAIIMSIFPNMLLSLNRDEV